MIMYRAPGKSAPFVQTHQSLVETPPIVADSASLGELTSWLSSLRMIMRMMVKLLISDDSSASHQRCERIGKFWNVPQIKCFDMTSSRTS